MDFFLIEKIAVKRLQQRCLRDASGGLLFRLSRNDAVAMTPAEWDFFGCRFRAETRRSARLLRWGIWLQIPFGFLVLVLVQRTPIAVWLQSNGLLFAAWVLVSVSLPVAGAIVHSLAVRRAIGRVVAALAARPRADLGGNRPTVILHVFEIVMLVLFGPGVFIDLYGSAFPHAFDHTPWMERHIGWDSAIGLAAFIYVVTACLWRLRTSRGPASPDTQTSPILRRRRALIAGPVVAD